MLKMLAAVAVIVVVLVAGLLIYATTKPDAMRVQRTASIKAPPERIFALINDFNNWRAWSPYDAKDPAMQREIAGAASGKGAVYAWDGNNQVGKGRMEILESTGPSKIIIRLDFIRPMENTGTATFTLTPQGDSTEVTWTMDSPAPYISKVMGMVFNLDKMIGGDFEVGLTNLKNLAEK